MVLVTRKDLTSQNPSSGGILSFSDILREPPTVSELQNSISLF